MLMLATLTPAGALLAASRSHAAPPALRARPVRCSQADDGAGAAKAAEQVPADAPLPSTWDSLETVPSDSSHPHTEQRGRIDQGAIEAERYIWEKEPATRQEMAAELPAWAAEMMLDDDELDSYEEEMASASAAAFVAVEGRDWEELQGVASEEVEDASNNWRTTGSGSDRGGLNAFTPAEIAQDYNFPLEAVMTELQTQGFVKIDAANRDALPNTPVRQICSARQLTELLAFLATADPIALREELVDETVGDLAADLGVGEATLEALCEADGIPLVLGGQTRLAREDFDALVTAAKMHVALEGK